jgi:hypothetical protein
MKPATLDFCTLTFVLATAIPAVTTAATNTPPFRYVPATAYHILPETTSDESGYFALCEGRNGKIYVGTAQYNYNSYLVEFDPRTARQRIVVDTRKLCGLTASGYAAQAKIHTRNFVGLSGKVYVGSKQGYRGIPGDASEYPGGYVMTYDPKTDRAECLGMPFPTEGVIDVVADESRGLQYIVTCEEQHYVLYDEKTKAFREPDPSLRLTPYATTLLDARGRAHAITKDFQLATYDPASDKIVTRDILVDGRKFERTDRNHIPTWNLAADGRTAYLVLMTDPTLITVDLLSEDDTVAARACGKLIEGKGPDSRCALSVAPDGRVYVLVRVDNITGFGSGYLHHLTRYTPKTGAIEDLGVLTVRNPGYFDWSPLWNGKPKPHTHGFHKLTDGTLTPLHAHMGLIVAKDGSIYVTILYPYTLLKVERGELGRSGRAGAKR